jgi:hypothetical protein
MCDDNSKAERLHNLATEYISGNALACGERDNPQLGGGTGLST